MVFRSCCHLLFSRYCHEVSANPQERWLGFEHTRDMEEALPVYRVVPPFVQIMDEPTRPLYPVDTFHSETRLSHFGAELIWVVEESVGKVVGMACRIPMLSGLKVSIHNVSELGILEQAEAQTVESRGKPGDTHGEDQALRLEDPVSFAERLKPIPLVGQMIERTELKNHISRPIFPS
jgi:hypothetical protein